jgi:hypothetical protein
VLRRIRQWTGLTLLCLMIAGCSSHSAELVVVTEQRRHAASTRQRRRTPQEEQYPMWRRAADGYWLWL